jgi:DNA-binding MarR family transcriptional regulator
VSSEDPGHDGAGRQPERPAQPPLGALLKHAYLSLDGLITAALAHHDMDRHELAVLRRLASEAWVSQQRAAERLGIDRTTMVAIVDRLEQRKLVHRRPDPADRRKNMVALTDAGHQALAAAAPTAAEAERRFLQPLGAADAQQFTDALRTLASAWESVRTRR